MKRTYIKPTTSAIRVRILHPLLSYSVNDMEDGGSETVKSDDEW